MNILYVTPFLGTGGIEKMMYEWISRFDKTEIHVDILVNKILDRDQHKRFENLGCNLYENNCTFYQICKEIKYLSKLLSKNYYDVIHVHTGGAFDFWNLVVAKHKGIKCRIIHSHNACKFSKITTRMIQSLSKPLLRYYATDYYACSFKALYSLCGNTRKIKKLGKIIPNGVNIDNFIFNSDVREKIRKNFGWQNKTVIGSVGRLNVQKNQTFLIDVFSEIKHELDNAVLLIIGGGELYVELKRKVEELQLQNDVIFTGNIQNVHEMYQAMDCFVLTSLYEGLVIAAIEAQCAGLKVFLSDSITKETEITDLVSFIGLDLSASTWARTIIGSINYNRVSQRENIINAGYDIDVVARNLQLEYLKKYKE